MEAVHVVVATHNRRSILARTLEALERQTFREFRVVVVDDGSSDGTREWLKTLSTGGSRLSLAVLEQDRAGQGAARNRALRTIETGLVVFLGDDVLLKPEALAEHRAFHLHRGGRTGASSSDQDVAVVGFTDWCRESMRVTPVLEMVNRDGYQFGYGSMPAGEEVPFTCFFTSNLSVPRRVLGERPFHPAFREYGWEDVELGYRLHCAGVPLYYHPGAAGEHLHPMTLESVWRRQEQVGRGLATLFELHPELRANDLIAPVRSRPWLGVAAGAARAAVPVLSLVDRAGVPLPRRLLHGVLSCAYQRGAAQGRSVVS